jgi:hypothetical protein
VRAQLDKQLTPSDANSFTRQANLIRAMLGC